MGGLPTANGELRDRFSRVEDRLGEVESTLASAVQGLKEAVYANQMATDSVSKELKGVSDALTNWAKVAETVIPIKAVFWLFVIMILGLVGIEGVKALRFL